MLGGDRTWSSELPMKGSQTSHCSPASQALLVVLQDVKTRSPELDAPIQKAQDYGPFNAPAP